MPDSWRDPGGDDVRRLYTCRASDKRPEDSGVPWRSFGLAWCSNPSIQAALGALAMPFTYSIANGLAFGFIAYAVLKAGTGRWRDVHPAVWLVAGLFVLRYALE